METGWMTVAAAALLFVAGYAQSRIPRYTAGATKILLTRTMLIVVGIAFGYVLSRNEAGARGSASLLLFLMGFGLVHLPAAFILFIKRERGAGRS
jgi:hypothetical protein